MAKFFFHVVDGEFLPDLDGTECATDEKVKALAVSTAGEMLKDQGLKLWNTGRFEMFVCDEQNRTHLRLSFHAEDLTSSSSAGNTRTDSR